MMMRVRLGAMLRPSSSSSSSPKGQHLSPLPQKGKKKKDEPGGEAFKLEPTKRRTGGKKSYSSRLKKSCVVS